MVISSIVIPENLKLSFEYQILFNGVNRLAQILVGKNTIHEFPSLNEPGVSSPAHFSFCCRWICRVKEVCGTQA